MSGPNGEACVSCYFFTLACTPRVGESTHDCALRGEKDEGYAGFCHKCPPHHEGGEYGGFYSAVASDDWCGEYRQLGDGGLSELPDLDMGIQRVTCGYDNPTVGGNTTSHNVLKALAAAAGYRERSVSRPPADLILHEGQVIATRDIGADESSVTVALDALIELKRQESNAKP